MIIWTFICMFQLYYYQSTNFHLHWQLYTNQLIMEHLHKKQDSLLKKVYLICSPIASIVIVPNELKQSLMIRWYLHIIHLYIFFKPQYLFVEIDIQTMFCNPALTMIKTKIVFCWLWKQSQSHITRVYEWGWMYNGGRYCCNVGSP